MPRRAIILDPSLRDHRGHHFLLADNLTEAAHSIGCATSWVVHSEFGVGLDCGSARVFPVFQQTMYDQYTQAKGKRAAPTEDLGSAILRSFEACGAGPEDHVLCHTCDGGLYRAFVDIYEGTDYRSLPFVHLATPYDEISIPGKSKTVPISQTFGDFLELDALNRKLFFWAETQPLARHMSRQWDLSVSALELPPPPRLDRVPRLSEGIGPRPLKVVYMGAAREEKGFLHLPFIVEEISRRVGTDLVHFTLQCSPQIIGYLPPIEAAIKSLKRFEAPFVTLIEDAQSTEDYYRMIAEADVVLLIYDQEKYRIRGSAIAVESVCLDRIVLATDDTFPASLLTRGGGRVGSDRQGWVDALIDIARNKERYLEKAALQGADYRRTNSSVRYIERLFERAAAARHLAKAPSAVLGRSAIPLARHISGARASGGIR